MKINVFEVEIFFRGNVSGLIEEVANKYREIKIPSVAR